MTQMDAPPTASALFDLSFTRFLTISVIKFIYILGMVGIAIGYLGIIIAGFANGGFGGGLVAIIVGAILALIYLLMLRVWLELIVVIFRIGESTSAIARSLGASSPTGGFPVTPMSPMPMSPGATGDTLPPTSAMT